MFALKIWLRFLFLNLMLEKIEFNSIELNSNFDQKKFLMRKFSIIFFVKVTNSNLLSAKIVNFLLNFE